MDESLLMYCNFSTPARTTFANEPCVYHKQRLLLKTGCLQPLSGCFLTNAVTFPFPFALAIVIRRSIEKVTIVIKMAIKVERQNLLCTLFLKSYRLLDGLLHQSLPGTAN